MTELISFVEECAYYDKDKPDKVCFGNIPCMVIDGHRCCYFERCVLGSPDDTKFRLPGYDYQKLFAQYAEIKKEESIFVEVL